eukprot:2262805-Prymnesium_polylepis.2
MDQSRPLVSGTIGCVGAADTSAAGEVTRAAVPLLSIARRVTTVPLRALLAWGTRRAEIAGSRTSTATDLHGMLDACRTPLCVRVAASPRGLRRRGETR